jgi:hypothetical protein
VEDLEVAPEVRVELGQEAVEHSVASEPAQAQEPDSGSALVIQQEETGTGLGWPASQVPALKTAFVVL